MKPAVFTVAAQLRAIGYSNETLLADYNFADVLSENGETRQVDLAAFTQTPPSYRTAAFAVVEVAPGTSNLGNFRALGAPMIFALAGDTVELWQVHADGPPSRLAVTTSTDLPDLFAKHAEHWNPSAIHRAKAIDVELPSGRQIDFVDLGLMIAIEGEVHIKLDALLRKTLTAVLDARGRPAVEARLLFQATFRFLAAKILTDRGHESAASWADGSVRSVLRGIDQYYGLSTIQPSAGDYEHLKTVWNGIEGGISFRNISADDLAFVYENTFVTSEARDLLGTHSTPRQMAEHIVRRLELWKNPERLRVYEPFTGAGILLVAALRQMRAALPLEWSDSQRHDFLTLRLSGDEIDEFACEVAKLSLILADYPNHNGWDIQQADLFAGDRLRQRITSETFVICNPPFADFEPEERGSVIAQHDVSKPVAILEEVIASRPAGLGFVLPSAFIMEKRYRKIRAALEQIYGSIEIVEIPDDVFSVSRSAASLLIAKDRRSSDAERVVTIRSSEVTLRDRLPFLKAGVITRSRARTRWVSEDPTGDLWVPALDELWAYLADYPKLGEKLDLHLGIRWTGKQSVAWSQHFQPGYRLGLHSANGHLQYRSPLPVWLDCRPESVRTSTLNLPWSEPKLILNGARLSRYPWRLAASVDADGLVCSQQFVGGWPRADVNSRALLALMAVLNSPVANAFAMVFSSDRRYRLSTLASIPIPRVIPEGLSGLSAAYVEQVANQELLFGDGTALQQALIALDALTIESYELPVRLERELLRFFDGVHRPVAHDWTGWANLDASPGLSLAEMLRGARVRFTGNWVKSTFSPLPEAEANALRLYLR